MPTEPYEVGLHERIRNSRDGGEGYLNAALEEGVDVFLVALKHVIEATEGTVETARRAGLSRVGVYKAASKNGNPSLKNVEKVLEVNGFRLKVSRASVKKAHTKGGRAAKASPAKVFPAKRVDQA